MCLASVNVARGVVGEMVEEETGRIVGGFN